jgi:hypothetical protein
VLKNLSTWPRYKPKNIITKEGLIDVSAEFYILYSRLQNTCYYYGYLHPQDIKFMFSVLLRKRH